MGTDDGIHPTVEETAREIASMEVRRAATIADAATTALRTQAAESTASDLAAFEAEMRAAARRLHETRPTAGGQPTERPPVRLHRPERRHRRRTS